MATRNSVNCDDICFRLFYGVNICGNVREKTSLHEGQEIKNHIDRLEYRAQLVELK
jgi:hypothetical protein